MRATSLRSWPSRAELSELARHVLEAQVEQLLLGLAQALDEVEVGQVTQGSVGRLRHQNASSRATKRALMGSFWMARSMAARAMAGSL